MTRRPLQLQMRITKRLNNNISSYEQLFYILYCFIYCTVSIHIIVKSFIWRTTKMTVMTFTGITQSTAKLITLYYRTSFTICDISHETGRNVNVKLHQSPATYMQDKQNIKMSRKEKVQGNASPHIFICSGTWKQEQ